MGRSRAAPFPTGAHKLAEKGPDLCEDRSSPSDPAVSPGGECRQVWGRTAGAPHLLTAPTVTDHLYLPLPGGPLPFQRLPLHHPDDRSLHMKLQTQALLHSFSCPGPRSLKSSSSSIGVKPSHLAVLVPHAAVVPQAGPVSGGHPAHLLQVPLDQHLQGIVPAPVLCHGTQTA